VGAVRSALESGHCFYTVSDTGMVSAVVAFDCVCGAETLLLGDAADGESVCATAALPCCEWDG
jgi:hypothetical protein